MRAKANETCSGKRYSLCICLHYLEADKAGLYYMHPARRCIGDKALELDNQFTLPHISVSATLGLRRLQPATDFLFHTTIAPTHVFAVIGDGTCIDLSKCDQFCRRSGLHSVPYNPSIDAVFALA